jgi:hypothetical protein
VLGIYPTPNSAIYRKQKTPTVEPPKIETPTVETHTVEIPIPTQSTDFNTVPSKQNIMSSSADMSTPNTSPAKKPIKDRTGTRWTPVQDAILISSRLADGIQMPWTETHLLFPGRSLISIQRRYSTIIKGKVPRRLPLRGETKFYVERERYRLSQTPASTTAPTSAPARKAPVSLTWTDAQDEKLVRLYFEMKEVPEIAKIMGMPKYRVNERRMALFPGSMGLGSEVYEKVLKEKNPALF